MSDFIVRAKDPNSPDDAAAAAVAQRIVNSIDMRAFYKALADDVAEYDGSPCNYDWLIEQIEDRAHPRLGPPIPRSMRPNYERMLREVYGPEIRKQINYTSVLMAHVMMGPGARHAILDEVTDE